MRFAPKDPRVGDWYRFSQGIAPYAPDKKHRWIVAGSGSLNIEIPALLRSTSPGFEGMEHDPHKCSCGSVSCRIDRPGWISDLYHIPSSDFTEDSWSCYEPSDEVRESVMQRADRLHQKQAKQMPGKPRRYR